MLARLRFPRSKCIRLLNPSIHHPHSLWALNITERLQNEILSQGYIAFLFTCTTIYISHSMSFPASSVLRPRAISVPKRALLLASRSRQLSALSPKRIFFGGRRPFLSQFISGLLFGVAVTAPIAGFYHFSGMRNAVNTAQVTLAEINQARDKIRNVKEKPSDALYLLRIAAKTYVQGIPFAAWGVDKAFDSVEATIDAHQEEAAVIIENLSRRMGEIVEHHKTLTVPAALELLKVVKEETGKLREVAVKAVKENSIAQKMAGEAMGVGKGTLDFVKTKMSRSEKNVDRESNSKS